MTPAVQTLRLLAQGVVRISWLFTPVLLLTLFGAIYWIVTGQAGIFQVGGLFAIHAVLGAGGAYALHEAGHIFVLMCCPGIRSIDLHTTMVRISVTAEGTISHLEALLAALAGPGLCGVVGAVFLVSLPNTAIGWWYVAQLIFLIPPSGDGRSILRSLGLTRKKGRSR